MPTGSFAGTAGQKFTYVLKYPFVDWNHQWLYADGATGSNSSFIGGTISYTAAGGGGGGAYAHRNGLAGANGGGGGSDSGTGGTATLQ